MPERSQAVPVNPGSELPSKAVRGEEGHPLPRPREGPPLARGDDRDDKPEKSRRANKRAYGRIKASQAYVPRSGVADWEQGRGDGPGCISTTINLTPTLSSSTPRLIRILSQDT